MKWGDWPRFWVLPDDKTFLSYVPKVASSAIRDAIIGWSSPTYHFATISPEDVEYDGGHVLAFIRDPFERLVSAWLELDPEGCQDPCTKCAFKTFVAKMRQGWNPHWASQTELHSAADGQFLPTEVYPYELLNEVWARKFPEYKLNRVNVTTKALDSAVTINSLPEKLQDWLFDYYKDDLKLRRSLTWQTSQISS